MEPRQFFWLLIIAGFLSIDIIALMFLKRNYIRIPFVIPIMVGVLMWASHGLLFYITLLAKHILDLPTRSDFLASWVAGLTAQGVLTVAATMIFLYAATKKQSNG